MPLLTQNQGYLLGVDTGTSKTHALIADRFGKALGFGESGPGKACYVKFGITPENVVKAAKKILGK